MMPLDALIFDVDGTLADTEEAHRRAFNLAFAQADLPWRWSVEEYRVLLDVAGGKERIRAYWSQLPDAPGPEAMWDRILTLHAAKTALYTEAVRSGQVPLRPGVEATLRSARDAGITLAIATTTSRVNVDALFEGTLGAGALGWFSAICTAETAAKKKPAPDVYLAALAQLGLPPARCLAVEDSRNGVLAARAAGLEVLVTENAYTRGQDFSGALAVLDDLTGLHALPDPPASMMGPMLDATR
ncbi:MAG: HAD-IA family hydrolase [Deltaproteobacteria bacterium]|nr:HAD-IA family hydrolase [Deltaproteobacteria bacterium]